MARANGSAEDTTKFTINTNQLSNRYPLTYKELIMKLHMEDKLLAKSS
jgi:hypothetical protein